MVFFIDDFINFISDNPNNGYYSYNYGKIHFICLETGQYGDSKLKENSEQVKWLEDDLKKSNENGDKWIIVSMHNGPYSTGDHSNDINDTQVIVKQVTPLFSKYHVDLVLQGHDHTYCKTLPYKWDSVGYTTTGHDENVVNFSVQKTNIDDIVYDSNPKGTYYVTTGAAGHRFGEDEKNAGIWAEVNDQTGEGIYKNSFTKNNFKKSFRSSMADITKCFR